MPDSATGDCDTGGECSLRAAVIYGGSLPADETVLISVGEGTHTVSIPSDSEDGSAHDPELGDIDVERDMTIRGQGKDLTTVEADGNDDRVFHIDDGVNVVFEHLTITGGDTSPQGMTGLGGGILQNASVGSLALDHVALVDNTASEDADAGGGAVFFAAEEITISNTTVKGNTAQDGGGMALAAPESVEITSSTFIDNSALEAGGGFIAGGITTFNVSNTSFVDNSAFAGGAISYFPSSEPLNLSGVTIVDNSAGEPGNGGAIFSFGGTVMVTGSVIAGNADPATGGENCAGQGGHIFDSGGSNLTDDESCELDDPTDQDDVTDVGLSPPGDYGGAVPVMLPLPGSPVIDAWEESCDLDTDAREMPRPGGDACDSGAVELQPPTISSHPAEVTAGENVTLLGSEFISYVEVNFRGDPIPADVVSHDEITFTVPGDAAAGEAEVTVSTYRGVSNAVTLLVVEDEEPPPTTDPTETTEPTEPPETTDPSDTTSSLVEPDPDFRFDDVPEGHVFDYEIHWLAANDVTRGCNPPENTLFCPDDPVTRGQMAAFLVRGLNLDPGTGSFEDTVGHVFEGDVAALAAADVTRGCNPPDNTLFCPDDPVTRGQMAAFLYRGLTG